MTLRTDGAVRLSEATSRLKLQIDGYRALANVIASEPILTTSALGSNQPEYAQPLLRAAMNNRLGFGQSREAEQRLIQLSRGVLIDGTRPKGVVVVSVSLSALEFEWPFSPESIVFLDNDELVFSSNRPALLNLSRIGDVENEPMALSPTSLSGGLQLWRFRAPGEDGQEVIMAEQFVPHLGLTGVIFLDTSDARATARLRAILMLSGALVLGLIGALALQQRRRRLLEEQYSAELEARVAARTKELHGAQDALVEASKLAALGRLSAGVSHELNQPLAAILNFAENGQKFLKRGRSEPAVQNLSLISDQVQRITRIIGNLRTFARQEVAPTDRIDLSSIVHTTLDLAKDDIARVDAVLELHESNEVLAVLAGRVRLEQVVLNLVTNALQAMSGSQEKLLKIKLCRSGGNAVLKVSDTGHGIVDPTRVFEPFYSTKDLGASKGLGMGLALSFGIIARFGGTLSCRNLTKGAEFKVTLPLMEEPNA